MTEKQKMIWTMSASGILVVAGWVFAGSGGLALLLDAWSVGVADSVP
jgi:hypothetical protein